MELVRLRNENIKEFKQLMIDAFQYGYKSSICFHIDCPIPLL